MPTAKMSIPTAITKRPSTVATSREAIGMLIAVAIAPGSRAKPVCVAVKPSTFCKNSGMTNAVPNRPKPVTMPIVLPALNERDLKTFKSTSGRGSYHSVKQKMTQREHRDDRQRDDRRRREPVFALSALEHVLQRRDAGRHQTQADQSIGERSRSTYADRG